MKLEKIIVFGVLILIGGLAFALQEQSNKIAELERNKIALSQSLSEQVAINTQQQGRIQHLAELETKHIRELANAKSEIDTLRADVAAGRRKLRIKAVCPVSETTSSRSMVDATTVELTGETGSTVLDIRESIINDLAKLRYLQDYVNTECYKVKK
ncbi:lysis protein [Xenorhabdus bovienii]|uniref:lysis protein n=1 Tax=Xenorhabdus bovienii TaxID=40576 RepID=UPI0023B2F179|nr:lysis protein [Xenorhabdus bovienii]MDE9545312.1 lysis protein [Xenorhabdus bovienii]